MQVPPFSLSQQIDDLGSILSSFGSAAQWSIIGGPQISFEQAFADNVGTPMPWAATAAPMP